MEDLPGTQGSTSSRSEKKPDRTITVGDAPEPVSKKSTKGDWSIEEVPKNGKKADSSEDSSASSKPPAPVKKTSEGDWEIEEVGKKPSSGVVVAGSHDLFNGRNLNGWHADVPELDTNADAKSPFIVREGMLVSLGTPPGHLITNTVYQNYRLEVQYRFPGKPGNCGVLVHASLPRALYDMFPESIEVQMQSGEAGDFWCIKEDISVPDMVARRGPRDRWGVDGDKARRIKNLTDGSENPPGEWNTLVIETLGNSIKVWVNSDLVNYGTDCTVDKGQIAIQAEGSEVEFREISLTPIERLSD